MKIAIEKSTGNALYMGDLAFGQDGLQGCDFMDSRMTPETCELIDMTPRPEYTYEIFEAGLEGSKKVTVPSYNPPPMPTPWMGGGAWVFNGKSFDMQPWAIAKQQADEVARLNKRRESMVATPWQIRKALNALGLRATLEAAVVTSDQATKDAWEFAQEFKRLDPLVISMGATLSKTPAELDALFELAIST